MVEQQYYSKIPESESFRGFEGATGHCTIACSPGADDLVRELDMKMNPSLSPFEHGGGYTFMTSNSRCIVLGRSSEVERSKQDSGYNRATFFVHNYILRAFSKGWNEQVCCPEKLTNIRFDAPHFCKRSFYRLESMNCVPTQASNDADIMGTLERIGIKPETYARLLADVIRALSFRLTERQCPGVVAVVLPEKNENQEAAALELIRCVIEGLPYGARRFFGYFTLYRTGQLTPFCCLLAVDRAARGSQSRFTDNTYDFSLHPETGKAAGEIIGEVPLYVRLITGLLKTGKANHFFAQMEKITAVENCHFQLDPKYLDTISIKYIAENRAAAGDILLGEERVESALRNMMDYTNVLEKGNIEALNSLFFSFLSHAAAMSEESQQLLLNAAKKLLLKKGEAFVREMADYISDSKVSYSGNIQAKEIADLIGQSEYHGVFLELLAQSHGRFVYEYCLNDIKCSDCLDDLFDIVERAYDGAGSCEEKKYLLKAAASEAQRISDNDSPVERNRKFLAQIKKHPGVGAFALLPVLEQKYLSQNAVGVPEYQEIRELRLILRECEKITDVPYWLVFYGKLADMYDWAVGREKKLPTELKNSLKEYYTVRTGDNPDFARRLDAWCNWLIKALTGRKRQKAFEWKWICFGCSCDNAEEELYHRFFCDELKRLLREPELKDFLKWFVESKLAELRKTKNKCGKHEKVYQACLNKLKEVMKGTALAWYSPRKSNELLKSFRVRPYREIYEKTVNPENAGTK